MQEKGIGTHFKDNNSGTITDTKLKHIREYIKEKYSFVDTKAKTTRRTSVTDLINKYNKGSSDMPIVKHSLPDGTEIVLGDELHRCAGMCVGCVVCV